MVVEADGFHFLLKETNVSHKKKKSVGNPRASEVQNADGFDDLLSITTTG